MQLDAGFVMDGCLTFEVRFGRQIDFRVLLPPSTATSYYMSLSLRRTLLLCSSLPKRHTSGCWTLFTNLTPEPFLANNGRLYYGHNCMSVVVGKSVRKCRNTCTKEGHGHCRIDHNSAQLECHFHRVALVDQS